MVTSAGILLYRRAGDGLRILLVHPGGPFFARRDAAGWSIPKGEVMPGEEPEAAARREFVEETRFPPPDRLAFLGELHGPQKRLRVWMGEGDLDPAQVRSNTFSIEWPPRSGTVREFPEVDRAAWFTPGEARLKLHAWLVPVLDLLGAIDILPRS